MRYRGTHRRMTDVAVASHVAREAATAAMRGINGPRPVATAGRAGYATVARTRGVYAQGEGKYFDFELAAVAVTASTDWTGTEKDPDVVPVVSINTLFAPTVGSQINQRIARHVFVNAIRIKGDITVPIKANQTASNAATTVRLILFQDMQTNSAQAQGEQVMRDPTTDTAPTCIQAFMSLANLGRFKILKEKWLTLSDPNFSWDGTNLEMNGLRRPWKMNVKFNKPVDVHFNAVSGGTIADIVDHSWHILAIASSISLAPTIGYTGRVYYKE